MSYLFLPPPEAGCSVRPVRAVLRAMRGALLARVMSIALVMSLVMVPGLGLTGAALAQTAAAFAPASPAGAQAVQAWLQRVNEAPRQRAYTGTFVVTAGASMSSARIWHVCDGKNQMERIEPLSGAARTTMRRDDQVITFYPQQKLAVMQQRDALSYFPRLLQAAHTVADDSRGASLGAHYQLKLIGRDRVVGLEADVVQLVPTDALRFGYRLWTDRKTGLLLRLQTLDAAGQVLEQSAFSELQLDAPVSMSELKRRMAQTAGYQLVQAQARKVTPRAQGWSQRTAVPGFEALGCYQHPGALAAAPATPALASPDAGATALQCMFSDGLATVSVFAEPFDARRHTRAGPTDAPGATRSLSRREGDWWFTAVGEVPQAALASFAMTLERMR